jgi:hypothetical protein
LQVERFSLMRRFRRETRTIRKLAKALAALDEHASLVRPAPTKLLRTSTGFATR